ncbi:MAG: biotin--[acetyl-CoA-carboxylase] ligase [Candidatus Puniceispirillum sp.]|nr:biotin--[acetyl-CoA-carboxylase] ligase [Candidatus Puniceispirillum sp.]
MSRWRILWEEEVTSTMDAVLAHLQEDAFIALAANHQTKGRGRMGRAWRDTSGTLSVSLAFTCNAPLARLPEISFVASLALYQTAIRYAPTGDFSLKWPNDLMLGGRKMAGLLLEIHTQAPHPTPFVIIGVGVNVGAAPALKDRENACLKDACENAPSTADFLKAYLDHFDICLDVWQAKGFDEIRSAWLNGAHTSGTRLMVHTGKERVSGSFLDLDAHGRLLLKRDDGEVLSLSVGDVFLHQEEKS